MKSCKPGNTRRCYVCGEEKTLDEFFKNSARTSGYEYRCKACSAKQLREYLHDPKIFAERLATQNGVCAVCGSINNGKRLNFDHNHKTNALRGLLCFKCNVVLGMVDDDENWLRALIIYLHDFASSPPQVPRPSRARKGKNTQVHRPCLECGKTKFIAADGFCWACYRRGLRHKAKTSTPLIPNQ